VTGTAGRALIVAGRLHARHALRVKEWPPLSCVGNRVSACVGSCVGFIVFSKILYL